MRPLMLQGDHYQMGVQHGRQVAYLRSHILETMTRRLRALSEWGDGREYERELLELWEEVARSTLEMLRGIADALSLPWADFFRYTVASYLEDRMRGTTIPEGCTAWAATAPATRDGRPILAKNRDYRPEHRLLQGLATAVPHRGYRYTYVTSAGSPGVFSSGMNEKGLAVADTHVVSLDIGPGLARYSLMMEVLERFASVGEVVDFVRTVPHLGDGTIVCADASGIVAAIELGHSRQNVVGPTGGVVVSTNHFVTPGLKDSWVDTNPSHLRGNSEARRQATYEALSLAEGQVDIAWAKVYMSSHQGRLSAMCRHLEVDGQSETISTVIFLPARRVFYFANGRPCQTAFQRVPVVPEINAL